MGEEGDGLFAAFQSGQKSGGEASREGCKEQRDAAEVDSSSRLFSQFGQITISLV